MNAKDYIGTEVKVLRRKWKGDRQVVTDTVSISRGTVVELLPNSRTMVVVQDTDRGPGWDQLKQKYVGVKSFRNTPDGPIQTSWSRGQNYCFGQKLECHISQLVSI